MEPQTKTARRKIGEPFAVGNLTLAIVPDLLEPDWCWQIWGESATEVGRHAADMLAGQRAKVANVRRAAGQRRKIDKEGRHGQ